MNANIGIDIGKKKCDYCVVNGRGRVLDRGQYPNTPKDVKEFAEKMIHKYPGCRAACETTGNMWNITYDACENAGIKILLANTYKMAIISKTAKKTDKVDAEKIAQILRMDMMPECFVPPREIRGVRAMVRQRTRIVQDRTRADKTPQKDAQDSKKGSDNCSGYAPEGKIRQEPRKGDYPLKVQKRHHIF